MGGHTSNEHVTDAFPASSQTPGATAEASPDPEREQFLEKLAGSICDRGMATPAMFLLESVKPLNFIGSQVLYALGPVASLVIEPSKIEKMAEALEDRTTIDRLLDKIEARESGTSQPS